MIAPMYTELPCSLRKRALFDVLDMGPIYSYGDVMLGLACHRTGMATNARLVVYYKSVVHHNSRDEQSMQKVLYQPIRIPRIAPRYIGIDQVFVKISKISIFIPLHLFLAHYTFQ